MKRMEINCPRCNHPQKFGQRRKEISPGIFQIYIECKKCRWKEVIMEGDSDTISSQRDIARLKIRAMGDPSLRTVLRRKLRKLNEQSMVKRQSDSEAM